MAKFEIRLTALDALRERRYGPHFHVRSVIITISITHDDRQRETHREGLSMRSSIGNLFHAATGFAALLFMHSMASVGICEELNLENSPAPVANKADEPFAKAYSLDHAVRFLDTASLDWTKNRKCFTCHTNFSYLMVRPAVDASVQAHRDVRNSLQAMVTSRWETDGPRWDAEVVMAASVLSINDAMTTGNLHPITRKALDRMWTVQGENGGFEWLKCGWPPMESDDHYGVTIALIGLGMAPENYMDTPQAQQGLVGLKKYLKNNPAPTLHHQAMVLWASNYHSDLLTQAERKATISRITARQNTDGGWALAGLGDWQRADKKEQDTKTSDGYATGFLIYALSLNGLPNDDPVITNGIAWLKSHQRASGRWHTRSLNRDNKHFISHAGTAFAVLALVNCDPEAKPKLNSEKP
jgi:squalene-hopene/tetraprenyl-beta-curcumene cyclase